MSMAYRPEKSSVLRSILDIEGISRSQVSEMTKGLNEQVAQFRNRTLDSHHYPILWADALYEDVRIDGHVVSEAIIVVCGVDEHGKRDVLAVEPMADESLESYKNVFSRLKTRGLLSSVTQTEGLCPL